MKKSKQISTELNIKTIANIIYLSGTLNLITAQKVAKITLPKSSVLKLDLQGISGYDMTGYATLNNWINSIRSNYVSIQTAINPNFIKTVSSQADISRS
jgi:ABC-type transporter Mla MlaB component